LIGGKTIMSNPFRERIENLLREGKISPEEANKLFRALDAQGETTRDPIIGTGNPAPTPPTPAPQAPPQPATQPAPAAPPKAPPAPEPTPSSSGFYVGPVKKVSVSALAGDIRVMGVAGLEQRINATGTGAANVSFSNDGDTIRITANTRIDNPTELGWLDTVFKAIGRAIPVDIHLEVPASLEHLEVKALAGDVDVRGVKGRVELDLQAGDLDLVDATSFRIVTKAGDVKVRTTLKSGESSVTALAGDVDVTLEPGSSVSLKASTTAGDVSAKGFILTQTDKRMTGGSLEGRLGAGNAKLEARLTAGDLDIIALDGEKQ
jgi:hypothetical protein